ncbi:MULTISPECIES: hypothetical protein [Actinosynnema]|uniref:hypothetical protein n=1 Tax=Actinosynnema TaxID=40566 RepID=UPI0020A284E4|nr:hypothetical protein [Actinosynnema pretiosum]MCP2097271.1 hypothetical protein [Actinosynnema pretiosum]
MTRSESGTDDTPDDRPEKDGRWERRFAEARPLVVFVVEGVLLLMENDPVADEFLSATGLLSLLVRVLLHFADRG